MSVCEDMLLCNYRKCRVKLSGYAWVTACSHIFCDQHGSGEFSRSPAVCPACSSALSGKLDIVRTELSPSEEYKAMVLAGLRPEIILDISSRALAFWTYQVHQERLYQEYTYSKAQGHLKQMEKVYTQQLQSKDIELSSMKSEVSSLKKVLEEYKKKFTELSEKLMERNRQYQKLQGLYDSLRLRNIAVASQEAAQEPPMMPQPAVFGFPLGYYGPLTNCTSLTRMFQVILPGALGIQLPQVSRAGMARETSISNLSSTLLHQWLSLDTASFPLSHLAMIRNNNREAIEPTRLRECEL
nr:PREDICTED: E3 ubiquitin-protein ligase CCNB1IP1 isoform X1 [Anolis carolinensis]XP_008113573.1 PREDICTED: E3 ubiquitin-protein ligase CCNB1IP1 isoform X1 [Anolis carolinensis]|eukprot:XP_008113572.1 PREDICTED: E3 ubiquitin-protein ligase CCNB1IP1 isoform X1 [Anolis carolinensis]